MKSENGIFTFKLSEYLDVRITATQTVKKLKTQGGHIVAHNGTSLLYNANSIKVVEETYQILCDEIPDVVFTEENLNHLTTFGEIIFDNHRFLFEKGGVELAELKPVCPFSEILSPPHSTLHLKINVEEINPTITHENAKALIYKATGEYERGLREALRNAFSAVEKKEEQHKKQKKELEGRLARARKAFVAAITLAFCSTMTALMLIGKMACL